MDDHLDRYATAQTRSRQQAGGNSVDNRAETVFTQHMTNTEKRSAEQEWEFQWMEVQRLTHEAAVAEATRPGFAGIAQGLRRRAAGHKAAATRIARKEGWA